MKYYCFKTNVFLYLIYLFGIQQKAYKVNTCIYVYIYIYILYIISIIYYILYVISITYILTYILYIKYYIITSMNIYVYIYIYIYIIHIYIYIISSRMAKPLIKANVISL